MARSEGPGPAARQEWLHLYALPLDMRKREARIRQLDALYRQAQALAEREAVPAARETVQEPAQLRRPGECPADWAARLARQREALVQTQTACWQRYQQAAAAIERCPDPLLRAVLHGRCLEGRSYPALAGELARSGIPATADGLRKAVDRWLAAQDRSAGPKDMNDL